jgi:hypothetical protein
MGFTVTDPPGAYLGIHGKFERLLVAVPDSVPIACVDHFGKWKGSWISGFRKEESRLPQTDSCQSSK